MNPGISENRKAPLLVLFFLPVFGSLKLTAKIFELKVLLVRGAVCLEGTVGKLFSVHLTSVVPAGGIHQN